MRHLIVQDSDIIEAVGYQPNTGRAGGVPVGALEVVFKATPDTVYRYLGVTVEDFVALVTAERIGVTFVEKYRKTKHPFTKSLRPDHRPLKK